MSTVPVERDVVGIFGRMNAGKSSVMNLITQQETSIVDPTPGTTADTKVALMELHGLGPIKLLDTAGADEAGGLGGKKRRKALGDLAECDLVLLVVDPSSRGLATERALVERAREQGKQLFVIYNLFREGDEARIPALEGELPLLRLCPRINIRANDAGERQRLLGFVLAHYRSERRPVELLPFAERDGFYVLNIPMDEETPGGRYLRPQAMVEEHLTRRWAHPVSYRMDLGRGRSADPAEREAERERYLAFLGSFKRRPRAVVTDSQAMDVAAPWTPRDIPLTTFSIVMANYMSRGRLGLFVEGLAALRRLRAGDRVLIAEACTHSRIAEDIGTVQLPRALAGRFPGVVVEHSFGRELEERDLRRYAVVVHCGGCMVTPQAMAARIRDLEGAGVPVTNYGLVLAWLAGEEALRRALEPWGLAHLS